MASGEVGGDHWEEGQHQKSKRTCTEDKSLAHVNHTLRIEGRRDWQEWRKCLLLGCLVGWMSSNLERLSAVHLQWLAGWLAGGSLLPLLHHEAIHEGRRGRNAFAAAVCSLESTELPLLLGIAPGLLLRKDWRTPIHPARNT